MEPRRLARRRRSLRDCINRVRRPRPHRHQEDLVDVEAHYLNTSPCIDLTNDESQNNIELVDLTSPTRDHDDSVIEIHVNVERGPPRLARRSLRSNSDDVQITLPDLDINEVFDVSTNQRRNSSEANVGKQRISCPICLDDDKRISRTHRQLTSTVCGHVFCNVCIKTAIKNQHRCPTCRKRLLSNHVHPIFLNFE